MAGEGQQAITIVTETRNLRIDQFTHTDDQIAVGAEWEDWLDEMEREFRYFKITDPEIKADAVIIYGGREIAKLAKNLPDPTDEADKYEKLKTKLKNYYKPKKNKQHGRYVFNAVRPV